MPVDVEHSASAPVPSAKGDAEPAAVVQDSASASSRQPNALPESAEQAGSPDMAPEAMDTDEQGRQPVLDNSTTSANSRQAHHPEQRR